jgi:CRISPR-associated exonuclease Cas4
VVPITPELRAEVASAAQAVREMLAGGELPPALASEQAARRCKACSLIDRCQPHATHAGVAAARAALFDPDS